MKGPQLSWRRPARHVARSLGPRGPCVRILQISDLHNSVRGFRFASALAEAVEPDLIVDTGDLSGVGGFPEVLLLWMLHRIRRSQVLAPGNHDSATTNRVLRRMGAVVLDRPMLAEIAGVRIWGYADPNRSPMGGPPYSLELARRAARSVRPPEGVGPYLIAVHDDAMVGRLPPEATMVLSGHGHVSRVWRRGSAVHLRCGSTGGGGPFGGPLQAAVIDLSLPGHRPRHIWLVETDGRTVSVGEALPAEEQVEQHRQDDREQQRQTQRDVDRESPSPEREVARERRQAKPAQQHDDHADDEQDDPQDGDGAPE